MFKIFPREVGNPKRKLVRTKEDLIEDINLHNGRTSCYTTVYGFERTKGYRCDYNTAYLDKVFFDFDSDNALNDIITLEEYYSKLDAKRFFFCSGGGYHYYVKCDLILEDKKNTLFGYHHHIVEELGVDLDVHIIGDLSRIARIPNTFNLKRKLFCIPLKKEWLYKGDKYIKEKAKKQQECFSYVYGKNNVDISGFSTEYFYNDVESEVLNDMKIDINVEKEFCEFSVNAKKCLSEPELKWKNRGALINYLFEQGYLPEEVCFILEKTLSRARFLHMKRDENQINKLWKNRFIYVAPNWIYR